MKGVAMREQTVDDELWERVLGMTRGAANLCFQCGSCVAACPWNLVREEPFSIRRALRRAQMGVDPEGGPWLCATRGGR